jgi:cytochrome c biogenesis protein CcmG/thiol:disulfide interchange protein DsbE
MRRMRSLAALLASTIVLAGCGAGEPPPSDPGATASARAAAAPERSLEGAPPALRRLYAEEDRLLEGGPDAFRARLRELRGRPVVVNKWASWCPPCRAEFPFFRSQAARRASTVAFIGVNSMDAKADAEAFLRRQPVGYPSYLDPDLEVAQVFRGVAVFPTTAFYDAQGKLSYLKQGGYATEEKLAEDIERYTG